MNENRTSDIVIGVAAILAVLIMIIGGFFV